MPTTMIREKWPRACSSLRLQAHQARTTQARRSARRGVPCAMPDHRLAPQISTRAQTNSAVREMPRKAQQPRPQKPEKLQPYETSVFVPLYYSTAYAARSEGDAEGIS